MDSANATSDDVQDSDGGDPFAPLRRDNLRRGLPWGLALVIVAAAVAGTAELLTSPDPDLAAACERTQQLPDASELTSAEHGRLLAEVAVSSEDRRISDAVDLVLTGVTEIEAGSDSAMTEGQARSLVDRGLADLDRACAETR